MSETERQAIGYTELLARDLLLVVLAAALFRHGAALSAGLGPVADGVGLVLGVALGACAFPLHEWGHVLGAVASRSTIRPATSLRSFFVFGFDSSNNTTRQFLAMTLGGWIGTAAAVWVAYGVLPAEFLASRVARGMAVLSVLLVVATEVPLLVRAYRSGKIPPVDSVGAARTDRLAKV